VRKKSKFFGFVFLIISGLFAFYYFLEAKMPRIPKTGASPKIREEKITRKAMYWKKLEGKKV